MNRSPGLQVEGPLESGHVADYVSGERNELDAGRAPGVSVKTIERHRANLSGRATAREIRNRPQAFTGTSQRRGTVVTNGGGLGVGDNEENRRRPPDVIVLG